MHASNTLNELNHLRILQDQLIEAEKQTANKAFVKESKPILPKQETPMVPSSSMAKTEFSHIYFNGNTIINDYELHYIAKPYTNRQLTKSDIILLLRQIQNEYVNRGYSTTRIGILNQDIPSKTLTLQITEGRIGRLYTAALTRRDKFHLWQLFPIKNGDIANDFRLKLGAKHINRLPSFTIQTDLYPGFSTGETNILTTISPIKQPWSFYMSFNSTNTQSFIPSFMQLTRDHLLGLYDQWKFNFSHIIQDYSNSTSATLTCSVPFKQWLWAFEYITERSNTYADVYSEDASVTDIASSRYSIHTTWTPIYNNGLTINILPGIKLKKTTTKQDGIEIPANSNNQSIASLKIHAVSTRIGRLEASITYEATQPWFNSIEDPSYIEPTAEHVTFEKITAAASASFSHDLPWIGTIASTLSGSGQAMTTISQSSEHAVLGGWYSVRGFNNHVQRGENTVVFKLEQMLPISQYTRLPTVIQDRNITLKWFTDAGIIYRRFNMPVYQTQNRSFGYAWGGGLGIDVNLFGGQFNITVARGFQSNAPIEGIDMLWSWSTSF